jgi:hypothetical protein
LTLPAGRSLTKTPWVRRRAMPRIDSACPTKPNQNSLGAQAGYAPLN